MLTELPIFYFKKQFLSVVEKRLSTYKKAYSFKTIQELKKSYNKTQSKLFLYNRKKIYILIIFGMLIFQIHII